MARVLLQPRGSARNRGDRNYDRSVRNGVPLAECLPYLTAEDAAALGGLGDPLRLWGSTPAAPVRNEKSRALDERRVGDEVFFYADLTFVARARIAYLMDNPDLARFVWDTDEDGETWRHMMALTDVETVTRPSRELLGPLGMDEVVRGITLLSQPQSDEFLHRWDVIERTDAVAEALGVLEDLLQVPIDTVARHERNFILSIEDDTVLVATARSPEGMPVPVAEVQRGLDLLRRNGSVGVNTDELGFRSAFVAAVLAMLPGARVEGPPFRVILDPPTASPSGDGLRALDAVTEAKFRLEQRQLRRRLLDGGAYGACALCGDTLPARLLVAAHIKRRAACTDDEKRDLANVAMLACVFGCDALFESGDVTVNARGRVVASPSVAALGPRVEERVRRIAGRRCGAFTARSAPYFAWHRTIARG